MDESNKIAEKERVKSEIVRRAISVYKFFCLLGVVITGMIFLWQFGPRANELRLKDHKIAYRTEVIEAKRGDVLAIGGELLATSIPIYDVRMDFAAGGLIDKVFYEEVDALAAQLSAMFGDRSKAGYKSMLISYRKAAKADKRNRTNRYKKIIPRRIDILELSELKKFPLFRLGRNRSGMFAEQIHKRIRPFGSLASRTIGSVNMNGVKVGIEGSFDDVLRGKSGEGVRKKISGDFWVPVDDVTNIVPENGLDVVTTIDIGIQDVAESALKKELDLKGADWGSVILMEVETGEIRAMTNITRKSPGVFSEDYNYAIGMVLEPGSTFKLATLLALLDDAGMSLDDMIDTEGGHTKVGGATIRDTHDVGIVSLRDVFKTSSNVGFAKAVYENYSDNPDEFVDYISKLGFDKPIGISILGEGQPVLKRPGEKWWDGFTLAMMSYGYALEITPIHTLTLYNAVANDGKMVRPILIKEFQEFGKTVKKFDTEVITNKICSDRTLKLVQDCLQDVVNDGTASVLKSPYYTVAAKTGTAQIAQGNRGYYDEHGRRHYLATLVGYFPADNPKYSCMVAIKTSSNLRYYGSYLAGPVFKAVADRVYMSDHSIVRDSIGVHFGVDSTFRALKGGRVDEIESSRSELPCDVDNLWGMGDWARAKIDEKGEVEFEKIEVVEGVVPNVLGMGLKEAIFLLEKSGMKVKCSGMGRVVRQSVKAGVKCGRGRTIVIRLAI